MRLRNVRNKDDIINNSSYLIKNYIMYRGCWSKLFGNDNPIYLEIGMGKGKFIIENALKYPNINFIGIEKYDSVVVRALQKIPDGLSNLFILRCDALCIDEIFENEITKIYLNFSDPWPKKRHHFRRLSSSIFLNKYDIIFKNNEIIEMRTDNYDLFSSSLVNFSQHGYKFEIVSFDFHNDFDDIITTEYEERFINKGNPILYLKCVRNKFLK